MKKKSKKNKVGVIFICILAILLLGSILYRFVISDPWFLLLNGERVTIKELYSDFSEEVIKKYDNVSSSYALVTPSGNKLFVGAKKVNKNNYDWFLELNGKQYGPFQTWPHSEVYENDILVSVSSWNEKTKEYDYWLFVNNKQYGPYHSISYYYNNIPWSGSQFVYDIAGKYAVRVQNERGILILHGEKFYGYYDQVGKLREFENEILFTTYNEAEDKSYIVFGEKVYGPYGSIDSDPVFINGTPAFLSWGDGRPYIFHDGRKIFLNVATSPEFRESKEGELHFFVPYPEVNPFNLPYGEFIYDKDGLRKVE